MIKNKSLPLFLVLAAGLIGGAIVPAIKVSLKSIPPMTFTFLRFFLAAVFIFPLFLREKPKLSSVVKVVLPSLLAAANFILFIYAVRSVPANIGQLIYVTTPIIVSVLSFIVLKEKLSFYKVFGVILGLMGAIYLLLTNTISGFSFNGNYAGFAIILSGAVLFSFYLVSTKKLQKKFSPTYITMVFSITTAFLALVLSFGELRSISLWSKAITGDSIMTLIYVSVFGTAVFYLLGQYIVKYSSPILSSVVQYVQVPFTVIWAYFLIGEKITANFILAAMMIILGAYLASK